MILAFHIIVALSSIAFSGLTAIRPSKQKLRVSYVLIALMLMTGFYLVAQKPSHMVSSCVSGLVYLGIVATILVTAHKRLATALQKAE